MKPRLVLYHDNCPDGFGAALAAWLRWGEEQAEYRGVNYGQPAPNDVDGREVWVLDFSYPRATLEALHARAASLRVLDHHKTAEADLAGLPYCTFDMKRSGATLAYDTLLTEPGWDSPSRDFWAYLQDRDLWTFVLPASREVSAAVWSYPRTFETWARLATMPPVWLAQEGVAILRYKNQLVQQMATQTTWREIGGYRVPVVNASVCFSEVGEALCLAYPEAPFAAYYFDRKDGTRQWGARSRGGFDVSVVAKALGGGGHPAAAGWTEAR